MKSMVDKCVDENLIFFLLRSQLLNYNIDTPLLPAHITTTTKHTHTHTHPSTHMHTPTHTHLHTHTHTPMHTHLHIQREHYATHTTHHCYYTSSQKCNTFSCDINISNTVIENPKKVNYQNDLIKEDKTAMRYHFKIASQ